MKERTVKPTVVRLEGLLCPYCGSDNTLPFEEDNETNNDLSVPMVIFTGLMVITIYLVFVVASYIFFPLIVLLAIIVSTRLIKKYDKKPKKNISQITRNYVCLSCNSNFNISD